MLVKIINWKYNKYNRFSRERITFINFFTFDKNKTWYNKVKIINDLINNIPALNFSIDIFSLVNSPGISVN